MGLAVYTAILVAVEVVLAEAAVEGDLVEGAFESSEFLIIQSLDEQGGRGGPRCLVQKVLACAINLPPWR